MIEVRGQILPGEREAPVRRAVVDDDDLLGHAQRWGIGDPLDADTLMGPLIDESAVDRVEAACRAVRDAGGERLYLAG